MHKKYIVKQSQHLDLIYILVIFIRPRTTPIIIGGKYLFPHIGFMTTKSMNIS